MRCHSCDAWVDGRMTHCPLCGWRVDERAAEPLPTVPKSSKTAQKLRVKRTPTYKTVMITRELRRLVTIGLSASHVRCRESLGQPVNQSVGVTELPEQERCVRLEPVLLGVHCPPTAQCELIDPLPKISEWRPSQPKRKIRRDWWGRPREPQPVRLCPPKWKRIETPESDPHVARCTKHLLVRETSPKRVRAG
jgi:hypothetical protein